MRLGIRAGRRGGSLCRGAGALIAGLLLALPFTAVAGASTSASFRVNLLLLPPFKDTPDCSAAVQGSSVSISCTPGPSPLTSPRYLLHVTREGEVVQTVDAVTDPGTVTSWRVVRGTNRDFLEIVVGW